MTEREHTHRHHDHAQHHDVDADIEHGRHAASMSAPERPLASGLLMRKARDSNGVAEGAEAVVASAAGSSGFALPAPVMRKFEDSLGTDLSSVRVHTGGASEAAASAVGARAYTTGQDIHFGAGQYDPSSTGGQHLLAHEVAHTVQQRGGSPMRQNKGIEVSAPHDAAEHEADRAADAMVAGRAAEVTSVSGLSRQVWRGLATAYSDDKDLKQLPPAPKFSAPDGAFTAMAAAVQASMKGEGGTLTAPTSSFDGSTANLIACRDNAEASQVYYATNVSSKWNPIKNNYDVLAKIAQADAQWAISMLANVRVAGSATGSWVSLANASNSSWADLVKHAESMSIEVKNKVEAAPLAGIVDGKQHFKKGDQEINTLEVGGAGMGLGTVARQLGIKAPDTSSYKTAMADYNLARNKLAPQQQRIITQLIPTNVASIKDKVKNATDEKEKWETIKSATSAFETGLSVAFGGAGFVEGKFGQLGTTEEGVANFDVMGAAKTVGEKAPGMFTKVIDIRIAAIQKQIDSYNVNLKTYSTVAEANALKAAVGEYQNGLVELREKAKRVEDEKTKMEASFKEFGTKLDAAMAKQGKAEKGSTENAQSAALFSAIRNASVATQGAMDGLASGGAADLPGLFTELAKTASDRGTDQTGGDGRRDPRSAVFAIESRRWGTASSSIATIRAELTRRQAQISGLETEFMTQFANSSHGTDSIK